MRKIPTLLILSLCGSCLWLMWPPHLALKAKPQTTQQTPPSRLNLLFIGDIMSHLPQIKAAQTTSGDYDFTPSLRYIAPLFEQADLTIGNLECTLTPRPPYTGYPMFKSPDQLATALKTSGIDVLVTANNHALDGGGRGLSHTLNVLRQTGFLHTGTFADSAAYRQNYPLVFYKNGFKIALLNYTHHTNGLETPKGFIVNRLVTAQVQADVAKAKRQNPDFIICFLHWGEENEVNERPEQRALAKLLHTWGCDLVVGAHPHVVQPIKIEPPHGQLTAYSLGNFISAQVTPHTEGGIGLDITLEKEAQKTRIVSSQYIPIFRYTPIEGGLRRYYALPVSPFETEAGQNHLKMTPEASKEMQTFVQRVRQHLTVYQAKERMIPFEALNLK